MSGSRSSASSRRSGRPSWCSAQATRPPPTSAASFCRWTRTSSCSRSTTTAPRPSWSRCARKPRHSASSRRRRSSLQFDPPRCPHESTATTRGGLMPATYTYPGVYVEEVPSGVHPIAGVSTSDTAFVDYFRRGPIGVPVRVSSFTEFEREFGGLDPAAEASYQVQQFFVNGGAVAWVVREAVNAKLATAPLKKGTTKQVFVVNAANAGSWGGGVQVSTDKTTTPAGGFNLYVREVQTIRGVATVVATEVHRNLSVTATDPRYAMNVVNADSRLVRLALPATGDAAAAGSLPDDPTSGDP